MSFFHLLKEHGFDWEKAREIFYGLTDPQIFWINVTSKTIEDKQNAEMEENQRRNKHMSGPGEINKKSFDLRG